MCVWVSRYNARFYNTANPKVIEARKKAAMEMEQTVEQRMAAAKRRREAYIFMKRMEGPVDMNVEGEGEEEIVATVVPSPYGTQRPDSCVTKRV